ncbi:MAG: hypothetical protein NC301_04385 [Bacteroides sp.]|nr:hypothetical protein [Bacteroides sp.]MCM1379695.1 hypothetical protein [Bacteroides sp.]MCM1446050.1 hypothetical protein [Prevotella sp.]
MKLSTNIKLAALALACSLNLAAADCDLDIQVVAPDPIESDITEATSQAVANRLTRALTHDHVSADENYGQFYLTAVFSHLYKETLAGPPMQYAVRTEMTLKVADIFGNKVFDSETIELRGVGTSEQRAFINALTAINAKNKTIENFINRALRKTISYFDKNYKQLLAKARQAATMRDYDQALYYSTLIPACCSGYSEAEKVTLEVYQSYIDLQGTKLLNQAKAEFAALPNGEGARRAYQYLNQIDPASSTYKSAMSLAEDIKKRSHEEYDFEVHKKYEDSHELKRLNIDAAKAIGVAYGKGQKDNTTNILWK